MTRTDPAVRRTLARLRLVRMQMRYRGALALSGAPVNLRVADVAQTWRKHGWTAPTIGRHTNNS